MSDSQGPSEQTEQTFEAELDQYYLEEFVTAADAITDECRLSLSESGIETTLVDPANVAMANVSLDSQAFLSVDDGEYKTGLPIRRFTALLDAIDESPVGLEYDDERRNLDFTAGPYRYSLACLDPESIRQEPTIPDMDLGFTGDIKIDRLREAIEWFDEFTTHVRVGYDPANSQFYMEGLERDRSGSVKTDDGEFQLDRSELEYVREAGPADSHFSLDYFKDILSAVPDGRTVTLEIGEEFPMMLSYKIGFEATGPNEGVAHGEVTFMQAPRIQSD